MKSSFRKISDFLLCVFIAAICVLFLSRSAQVHDGVVKGLRSSAAVLIPSLFPFMVVSGLIQHSRARTVLERCLSPVMRFVFKLPKQAAGAVLMGFIGGYPVGAKSIAELLKEKRIDKEIASRMLCFCVNAGPSFLISAVGAGMFGSLQSGVLLLGAQWLSSVVIGFVLGQKHSARQAKTEFSVPSKQEAMPFSSALILSVQNAISGMLSVIGYVLLFSAVTELYLYYIAEKNLLVSFVAGLFEVTLGCTEMARQNQIILAAFLSSFSGFSVICQAISFFRREKISFLPFLFSRIAHGFLSALFVKIGLVLFPQTAPVFSGSALPLVPVLSYSPEVSVLLLVLCGVFLLSLPSFAKKEE